MKKSLFCYLLLFSVLLSFVACKNELFSSKNSFSLTDKNFDEVLKNQKTLIFTFDKALVTDDQRFSWDENEYIKFDPPLEGKFKWNEANQLSFHIQQELFPGTSYTASLTDLLGQQIEEQKYTISGEDEFTFATEDIVLQPNGMFWKLSSTDSNTGAINANLHFNYSISPQELQDKLSIKVNNQDSPFKLLSTQSGKSIELEIAANHVEGAESEVPIIFTIDKGFSLTSLDWKSPKKLEKEFSIASPAEMEITAIEAKHNGIEGNIVISTSQQVNKSNLKDLIKITPAVKYELNHSMNGFTLRSEAFDLNKTYSLTISKDLTGVFKGKLGIDKTEQIAFGELAPSIAFVHQKAMYLSEYGQRNLSIKVINCPKIKVEVYKIFENNIHEFLRQGKKWKYDRVYNEEEDYWDYESYRSYNVDDFGELVYSEERESKTLERSAGVPLLNFNIKDKLSNFDGMFVVKVSNAKKISVTDSKIVSATDIGLIAKQGINEVMVFANSIDNASAKSGVDISFISASNQVMAKATTNSEGIARLNLKEGDAQYFDLKMITAQKGSDYNFLHFSQNVVETSRFDVGGHRQNPAQLEAFIYGERNIYRPGETINLNTVIRTTKNDIPASMPIKLRLKLPDGSTFKTLRNNLNNQGAFDASFDIPANYITGTYTAEVLTGDDVLLNSLPISIEEFMPDRIKVELSTDDSFYMPNTTVVTTIKATNFFGPAAADRNYQTEFSLKEKVFKAKEYPNYHFDMDIKTSFGNKLEEGQTDENGEAVINFEIPKDYSNMGLLNGRVLATVFDESGRPVNRSTNVDVYTQDIFFGIKKADTYYSTREAIPFNLIALDKNEKLKTQKAIVQIIKYDWRTVMERASRGNYRYRSEYKETVIEEKTVELSGSTNRYDFMANRSGRYEIRVSHPNSKAYVKQTFYAYGWNDTDGNAFEVNSEGKIDIVTSKEIYQSGEQAKLLFKTPFDGRLIVTIEKEDVLSHYFLETANKSSELDIYLEDKHIPNVYVSATLVRPMSGKQLPLTVAHGYAPIQVENQQNTFPIEIIADQETRSNRGQKVQVKTRPNAEVTLAIVDEGILSIKDYQSPNPYDFFYQKQALAVNSYDLYAKLLPEIIGTDPLEGGGGALGKRTNPVKNKRVKLIRYWSGPLKADASGNVEYNFQLPKFSGQLRVMAVAYDEHRYANADHYMTVADPLVVSTGLPRFLSPTDNVNVPVTLTNTTNQEGTANVQIVLDGPLSLVGDENVSVTIPAKSEKRVDFKVLADKNIGPAKVSINANAMGETFTEEVEISVRPPSSLVKVSDSGIAKANQSITIDMPNNFISNSIDGQLIVSRSPMVEWAKDLDKLIRYPHGCLEQTISKAFPQIYFADLTKLLFKKKAGATKVYNPNANVQAAIKKIENLQIPNGGMAYWPLGDANWWGSIYAAHFLLECQKAGFEVNDRKLKKLFAFLKTRLAKKETFRYTYNGNQYKSIARREVAYSLYVLALAGQPEVSTMNYYKGKPDKLSLDSKYLLAGAYALSGDNARYQSVLPASFSGEISEREFGGSFSSPIRDRAIALNVLLEANPDHPQIPTMIKHLSADMKSSRYLNTQERLFGFLALGKMARQNAATNATATLSANGQNFASFDGGSQTYNYQDFKSDQVSLTTEGNGPLYYFWDLEGLTIDGKVAEVDNFLSIRKDFFDRYGRDISLSNIEQNDLIVVRLELQSTARKKVENVVITDILPACFEIENSRITAVPELDWIKDGSKPDHADLRDDRVHFFTTATQKEKYFYYMVRAVSKGEYQMGPASADAMYNGEFHSYNGAGSVTVK